MRERANQRRPYHYGAHCHTDRRCKVCRDAAAMLVASGLRVDRRVFYFSLGQGGRQEVKNMCCVRGTGEERGAKGEIEELAPLAGARK